jgi:guanylate kinase
MKPKLIIITGITMAGKSSTAKTLVNMLHTAGVAVELLKETTTRPRRESDYSNPEYNFVTEEEYDKKEFYASVSFEVSNGEHWKYGIERKDLPEIGIIVSNMYAIDQLLSSTKLSEEVDLSIFYLKVSKKEILRRDKGDRTSQKGDDVMDRIKRDIDKYNYYYQKHQDKIHKISCDNSSLYSVVENIYSVLEEQNLLALPG